MSCARSARSRRSMQRHLTLVFGGGTALARAHRIVRRMSEDVDFKIVPRAGGAGQPQRSSPAARARCATGSRRRCRRPASLSIRRKTRRSQVARRRPAIRSGSFPMPTGGAGQGLRPAIKVELNYAPLRRPTVMLPVSSFVAEAHEPPARSAGDRLRQPRRDGGRKTGFAHAPHRDGDGRRQPRLRPDARAPHLRSAHDARHLDLADVAALARDIAEADAREFRNQYPAYAADIAGETRKALDALRTDPLHRRRYDDFVGGNGVWREAGIRRGVRDGCPSG